MPSGREGLVVVPTESDHDIGQYLSRKCRPAGKDSWSSPPKATTTRDNALAGNAVRPGRTRGRPHRKRPRHALADALCQPKPATQFRYDVEGFIVVVQARGDHERRLQAIDDHDDSAGIAAESSWSSIACNLLSWSPRAWTTTINPSTSYLN